jgi:putative ABC transport system permease protein
VIFLRNVLRAPARSLMTVLGIAAGVALFVAITAITLDLTQQIEGAADTYKLEIVVYERRATSPFSSRIGMPMMAHLQARYGAALTPLVIGTRNEHWSPYALVVGVTPEFLRTIPLTAGAHYVEGSGDAMIGEIAIQKLHIKLGQAVILDGHPIRISGIFRSGSRMLDGGIMTDVAQAQKMLAQEGSERQYTLALLRSGQREEATRLIRDINQLYPTLKAIPGTEFSGSLRLLRVIEAFVTTISVVALVGTCLVVSNTLLMAIAERTREIGILMAVGWTPWLVLRMLCAESLVLCLVGALAGNGFALILLQIVNGMESVGFGWIPLRYPLSLAAASFGMSLGVALVSLAWPTLVLLHMQPLAALRHE